MVGQYKKGKRVAEPSPIARERFWEIDFLRGCAVILMLGFHWTMDRYIVNGQRPGFSPVILSAWQMVTAGLFLLLVGVSLTFNRDKPEAPGRERRDLRRGMAILGWGLLISLITWRFLPKSFVAYGILHLIGTAVLISRPFLQLKTWNLALGIMAITLGIYLNRLRVPFSWLLWAGLVPEGFGSIDYFPVFPWYGLVLIGIFLGRIFYGSRGRNFSWNHQPKSKIVQWLCFFGRNSLLIYLVHQPVLLLLAVLT